MSKSIREIKSIARKRVNNNFGDAFIIVFVPFLIMTAANILLSQLTMYLPDMLELFIDFIIQLVFTIFATYLSYKLLIQHVRSTEQLSFNNFFDLDSGLINYAILRISTILLILLALSPTFPILSELLSRVSMMVDPEAIEMYLVNTDIIPRTIQSLKVSSLLLLIFWLLTVRLQMIPYIIADKKVNIVDAVKISFRITKGNYFKILFFPFTYILWLLLLITGIGAIYVIPLIFVGYGYLYLSLIEN